MNDLFPRVAAIAAEAFQAPEDEITAESTPDSVKGWDSMAHMRFVAQLEETFGVSFEIDEIVEMLSIQAALDLIQAKRAA